MPKVKTSEKVVVKKINAYPFNVSIKGQEATPIQASVIKVTAQGFFADLNGRILHLNSIFDVIFDLPTMKHEVSAKVKVMRYIDRSIPDENKKAATKAQRLIEFHFLALDPRHQGKINDFCKLIKQV